ncbi:hypothetical protein EDD11_006529 [Mortierella claussenii]|nr:hypothetical protein EDD11_006529 [Mortierella claussenii]
MTASTLSSPALAQAQTKEFAQSHLYQFDQSAMFLYQNQQQQHSSSPTMSSSSLASSPSPSATSLQHQTYQQEQHHHHMQILGNHPASPEASGMFLDLPADAFMNTEIAMTTGSTGSEHLLQYTSAPTAEDCQASHEYMYAHQQHQQHQHHQSNEQFAAMAPSYMMSMARSFSDSQITQICGSAVSGVASAAVKTELCDSPLIYTQQSFYNDDSHYNNYVNQPQHNHHHQHSYSTSSSNLSDDSSMSPRSTFSSGTMSLSNSSTSITSYPLTRTLSEPLFHQGMISGSSTISDLSKMGNNYCDSKMASSMHGSIAVNGAVAAVKPTPKRSRGRRVSVHPDNSGCKVFTCRFEDCGKIFKRSEHLKRHVRSIHTLEKPFPCPIHNCPKRFSRSDNLNQHIRIHRHSNGNRMAEKNSKAFSSFTPFLQTYSADLIL